MSNVVQFLEAIGCHPAPLSADAFAVAVDGSGLPAEMKQALLAGNIEALRVALGGRAEMLCMIVPAENDEPAEEDPIEGDEREQDDASAF